MKLTTYFIEHPVIAIVINSLIIVMGILCFYNLPVREYPAVSIPTITVSAAYPNASPELIETSVTNVLEDRLAGIEGLDSITSQSNAGSSFIIMNFKSGVSMDKALTATQDAVSTAKALLPPEVKLPMVERQRKANGIPFIALSLESNTKEFGELTHYANLYLKNTFRAISGVASVEIVGQPYTYTIELDPEKLFSFGINVDEVMDALASANISFPAGNYQNKIPSTLGTKLKSREDYENLLIKPDAKHPIFLKSIANIELKTDRSQMRVRVNGHAGLLVAINRAEDANPLDISKELRKLLPGIQQSLPKDMKMEIIIDQSDFINASLKSVRTSIIEAIILVLLIVFLFLRNFRATLIPLVTIPISLLGSLLFLQLFGFSINLLTLLAMVLAIGLVVDDAIIVLENIWRHIEKGLAPIDAAIKGAREIGFAIVAMTFTLTSVYLPVAFIHGTLGKLFIEFAVALAGSVFISGIVALTLSPLMCAHFLRKDSKNWFPFVDQLLQNLSKCYSRALQFVFQYQKLSFLAAVLSIAGSLIFYNLIAHEIAPKEDRGLMGVYIPSTVGENIDMLENKLTALEKTLVVIPEADTQLTFMGDWGASILLPLKPHAQRSRSTNQIVDELRPNYSHYPSMDPQVWSWNGGLPGVDDVGSASDLILIISTPDSYRQLFKHVEKLKAAIDTTKQFAYTQFDLKLDTMGYHIELDHNQLAKLKLKPSQVAKTIEVYFSGDTSQTFEKDGVVYQLTIKGPKFPWTLDELYLTTPSGKRVSIGAIAKMTPKATPTTLEHVQQMRSTTLRMGLDKGISLDNAINTVWKLAKENLPQQDRPSWRGAAKTLHETSHTMLLLLFLAVVFIYAILAMQFENFIDPLIILFTAPLACFGALLLCWLFGQTLNIYTQVGLITLIGLITKHGILMVEFANQLYQEEKSYILAIQKAAVLRLRPILMTTGAMVFGAIPLILSHNAGYESRHAIGIVLIGGLCLGTLFTLFVLPSVYAKIKAINE